MPPGRLNLLLLKCFGINVKLCWSVVAFKKDWLYNGHFLLSVFCFGSTLVQKLALFLLFGRQNMCCV